MAKYDEYAQKYQDNLEGEIDEAAVESEHRQTDNAGNELPERFRDKSPAEIARSYEELEKAFSRQGNDLGELRRTVDQFMALQSEANSQEETSEKAEPISIDDLYDDTDNSIRRVVREEAGSRLEQLEQALAEERFNARLESLDSKYEGWREVAESPQFVEWVNSAPYRARIAAEARESMDVDAAETLLSMYYDLNQVSSENNERRRDEQLRQATLESSGPEQPEMVETFSRAELMQKRIAAKQGDPEATTWLKKNQERIAIAYEEGHITD